MYKKIMKNVVSIVVFCIVLWIFSSSVNAATVGISASTSMAKPGQIVTITISSDCTGRVNLSASNGTLKENKVFVEGNSVSTTVTVGNSGITTVTATPADMSDSAGSSVSVSSTSTSITIEATSTENPNNNENTNSNNSSNNNNSTNNSNSTTTQKSNNANLKNLGIRPNDFSGFKPGTTTYNVTVPNNVTSVELYATKQDSKATLTGTGNKTLKEGTNALSVTVTAEDGTQKAYTVNVTRQSANTDEEQKEKETNEETPIVEENNNEELNQEDVTDGLIELQIEGVKLNPDFKIGIYEYTAKYIGEDTSLNIVAKPSDEKYVVEIIGNKDLVEGENLITILVSDSNGKNVATYQITVNKSLVDEEALAREAAEKQEEKKKQAILGGAIAVLIIVILIVVIIVRSNRKKNFGEDYTIPYSGLNDDYNDNLYNKLEFDDFDDDNDNNEMADESQSTYTSDYDDDFKYANKRDKHKGKRFK